MKEIVNKKERTEEEIEKEFTKIWGKDINEEFFSLPQPPKKENDI